MLDELNELPVVDAADPWLLRPDVAADKLSISRSKLYQLMSQGKIPVVDIGGCRRIDAARLRAWIQEQTSPTP